MYQANFIYLNTILYCLGSRSLFTNTKSIYQIYSTFSLVPQKPIVALLSVPTRVFPTSDGPLLASTLDLQSSSSSSSPSKSSSQNLNHSGLPTLRLPSQYTPKPDPSWRFKRHAGRLLGRVVGALWSLLVLIGLGSSVLGLFNALFLGYAFRRWSGVGYPYDGLAEGSSDSTESLLESGSTSHT